MQQLLITNARKLGLTINVSQAKLLLQYLSTLQQWNKIHNLCAKDSDLHFLGYHILDSLSLAGYTDCNNQKIIDLGTGAGLPGIPIAIITPTAQVTLLEPKAKKIVFLQHIVNQLQLNNVTIVNARIEDYVPIVKYDLVITRATFELTKYVELSTHLIDDHGKIIAMKSMIPDHLTNNSEIIKNYIINDIKNIQVPLVKSIRSLITITKASDPFQN